MTWHIHPIASEWAPITRRIWWVDGGRHPHSQGALRDGDINNPNTRMSAGPIPARWWGVQRAASTERAERLEKRRNWAQRWLRDAPIGRSAGRGCWAQMPAPGHPVDPASPQASQREPHQARGGHGLKRVSGWRSGRSGAFRSVVLFSPEWACAGGRSRRLRRRSLRCSCR